MSILYSWLESCNVPLPLYEKLDSHMVDETNFLDLGPADWNAFGITSATDKMKLMQAQKYVRAQLAASEDDNGEGLIGSAKKAPAPSRSTASQQQQQQQQAMLQQQQQQQLQMQQQQQQQAAQMRQRPGQNAVPPMSSNLAAIKQRISQQPPQQQSAAAANLDLNRPNSSRGPSPAPYHNQPNNLSRQPSVEQQYASNISRQQQQNNSNDGLHQQFNQMQINRHQPPQQQLPSPDPYADETYDLDDNGLLEDLPPTDPIDDDDDNPFAEDNSSGENDVLALTTTGFDSKGQLAVEGWVTHSKIRVAVRKRPLFSSEKKKGDADIAAVFHETNTMVVHEPKQKVDLTKYVECHEFTFDECFDEVNTNEQIYAQCCKPLVAFFLNKGKATCFAYGQTGSGKTFTMMGPGGGKQENNGLYVLAARDIFKYIRDVPAYKELQVYVSFFEIYGGKLYDLLNKREKLVARQDANGNVQVVGLAEKSCHSVDELLTMITDGNAARTTASTGANADSSRSHAILQIVVKNMVKMPGAKPKLKTHGKFSFIDLAGSERAADTTNNNQQTRLEGAEINKSLLALKECIRALDMESKHLPFRGSQLTQVLKDSFIGNSRTVMLANVSPNSSSCEHTLNTLRYADRVKELKRGEGGKLVGGAKGPNAVNAYMPHQEKKAAVKKYAGDVDQDLVEESDLMAAGVGDSSPRVDRENQSHQQQQPPPTQQSRVAGNVNKVAANGNGAAPQRQQQLAPPAKHRSQASASEYDDSNNFNNDNDGLTHSQQFDLQSQLIDEQVDIVQAHRSEIDATMQLVRREMEALKLYDLNNTNVTQYVNTVDDILRERMETITTFRRRLLQFKSNLQQEEQISSRQQPFQSPVTNAAPVRKYR